jgi:SAM-dependent methyltransferase
MPVGDNLIRLLGRYSTGLRLAAEHGSASAPFCEYVYDNTPQGSGPVGRWIDSAFLGLSTWESIRQRIQSTKELVAEIAGPRRAAGRTTVILDVASGTGRYLRELMRERTSEDLIIVCHDRDPRQVVHGRQLVEKEGLERFSFSVGDATDESSYLTSQDPDIILAIGLFPYLYRDDAVRTVMRLAFRYLSPGGSFVCTTLAKPYARLGNWESNGLASQPAIRPPELIGEWLRVAGFTRIDQRFSQPHGFALIGWKPED